MLTAAAQRSSPAEADMAAGCGQRPEQRSEPPAELQIEPSVRPVEAGLAGGISETELRPLLADAHCADAWPDIQVVSMAAASSQVAPPLAVLAEHAAGSGPAQLEETSDTDADFPPPDLEPAAAKEPQRQLSPPEIDSLLARLLGS